MKSIAIFDMDRTITRTGTYTPFLLYVAARRQSWRLFLFPLFLTAMLIYRLGLIERKILKEFGFFLMVGERIGQAELDRLGQDFAQRTALSNVYRAARARIAEEKRRGSLLVLATASPQYYASEIGRLLGFDTVIATEHVRDRSGDALYRIAGENCYGAEKLNRVQRWLQSTGLRRSDVKIGFYSDHSSDAHVMAWADTAIAVNPDRKLQDLAAQNRWTVLRFGTA